MYTCKWNQFRFEIVETEISCVCAFWFITRRVFWSRRSSTGFIFSTTIGVTSSWLISIQSPNWQQNDDNSIFIVFIMIEIVTHFCKKLGQARKLWKLMQQTNGWNGGHWTRLYFPCCSPPTQEFLQFLCNYTVVQTLQNYLRGCLTVKCWQKILLTNHFWHPHLNRFLHHYSILSI